MNNLQALEQSSGWRGLRLPEDRQAGLVQILFDCLKRWGIVECVMRRVNRSFCARLCKSSEISENFFAQKRSTMRRAPRGEFCERITESMPNGFYGSKGRWEKMEAPFRQVDRRLEEFAKIHGMSIQKNYHNWPPRSLSWTNEGITRLIQISLKDDTNETYCIWFCAWQDRGHDRY